MIRSLPTSWRGCAAHLADPAAPPPEVPGEGGRTYRLTPVLIREFEFMNLYGTDITAERAIDKFPDQNPNPVFRIDPQAGSIYANPASAASSQGLGAGGRRRRWSRRASRGSLAACEHATDPTVEVEADGSASSGCASSTCLRVRLDQRLRHRHHRGAAGRERLARENERLLLNILPELDRGAAARRARR